MSPADWDAVRLSLMVAAFAVAISLLPGYALGWLLARKQFPGKTLLEVIVHAPLVVPPVVTGFVLLRLLGPQAGLGRFLAEQFGLEVAFHFPAAVIAAVVAGFPLLVRAVRLSIALVAPGLETAAAVLGASPLRVFLTVTLPLSLPGLIAGCLLTFVRGLGEFGATITFAGNFAGETRTIPLAIFYHLQIPGRDARVWTLALVSLAIAFAALLLSEWQSRRVFRKLQAGD